MASPKVYAFDVDNTLNLGPFPGPVVLPDIEHLFNQGCIIGICGHYIIAFKYWPQWWKIIAFFGGHPPVVPYKPQFLQEVKASILAGDPTISSFTMVGNSVASAQAGLSLPSSRDDGAARLAGWRFIEAQDFARGVR